MQKMKKDDLVERNTFDAEAEFMEYLRENAPDDYELFDESKSGYSYFENMLISNISKSIPDLINKMSEARGVSPDVYVFCLQKEFVNALCFKKNQHYYIGIYSAAYVELIRRTQILAGYLVRDGQWELYKNRNESELQALLWIDAFRMILTHEFMHIILGHCDTVCNKEAFLWEVSNSDSQNALKNRKQQALEMFADAFAAEDAVQQIFAWVKDLNEIRYRLLNYYLSIVMVFSVFDKYQGGGTHPGLGVRFLYMSSAIDDTIRKVSGASDPEKIVEEIDTVIILFMEIIQQYPRIFAYNIIAELGDENIYKEYVQLYNTASDIVKETNKYALYHLEEFSKIGDTALEAMDNERNILYNATNAGMSYDEACEMIYYMKRLDNGE